jgi:D-alanyl-D-alanine carboxypeptidase/D-alanyl-D-alanine-endopeptidase (penicillin-binding protein 4)
MTRPAFALIPLLALSAPRSASGADLAETINILVRTNPLAAHSEIGVHVVELKTGKVLYAHDESRFFLPASNMKLFTTGLALLKLGADYRYDTRLIEEASGDLSLVGSGDPSMSGRQYPYRPGVPEGPPLRAIEDLAQQAVTGGLTHVHGNIVGDDRLYPWEPYPPNWTQNDPSGESGAPVSALTVADNLITVTFLPGAKPGDLGGLLLNPPLEYFAIDNRIVTVAGSGEPEIHMSRPPGTRQILFDGTIPQEGSRHFAYVTMDDPALYAACALYDALTRRGVAIDGHPVARHRANGEAYKAADGKVLAFRYSPPASQLIQMADKVSQNLHAELLLREVARVEHKSSSLEKGVAAMNAFLAQIGAGSDESRIDDGSGLSRATLVTPRLVTRLLAYMYSSSVRDNWISMLPIGGEDGTLARRLCCTLESHSIHAKTGTLGRAIALSGYADSRTRGWLAFSILVNDFAAAPSEIQAWIDKIALALVE